METAVWKGPRQVKVILRHNCTSVKLHSFKVKKHNQIIKLCILIRYFYFKILYTKVQKLHCYDSFNYFFKGWVEIS